MSNTPDSNRALKTVVISMGLVLIGGTILLFVLIFSKMAGKGEESAEIHTPRTYRHCDNTSIALAPGETVKQIEFDGVVARVITDKPAGATGLKLVHSCSGELLGSVEFTHGE